MLPEQMSRTCIPTVCPLMARLAQLSVPAPFTASRLQQHLNHPLHAFSFCHVSSNTICVPLPLPACLPSVCSAAASTCCQSSTGPSAPAGRGRLNLSIVLFSAALCLQQLHTKGMGAV